MYAPTPYTLHLHLPPGKAACPASVIVSQIFIILFLILTSGSVLEFVKRKNKEKERSANNRNE